MPKTKTNPYAPQMPRTRRRYKPVVEIDPVTQKPIPSTPNFYLAKNARAAKNTKHSVVFGEQLGPKREEFGEKFPNRNMFESHIGLSKITPEFASKYRKEYANAVA